MKEAYFTPDTITAQTKLFLQELTAWRCMHTWFIKPSKAALLIIDMQKFFLDENSHAFIPSATAIIPRILKLQNYFLQHDLTILQTLHGNTEENAGQMGRWWRNNILECTNPQVAIISAIAHKNIKQLLKPQYDAFLYTNLEAELKRAGIEQVIITGVMAHLCCESTARGAFMRGFEVFFTVDATATYNSAFHLATLRNLAHGFAHLVTVEELLCQLQQA